MKIQVLFVPLLLMSTAVCALFWKGAATSGLLLAISEILLAVSVFCKIAWTENEKGSVPAWAHGLQIFSAGLILISLWYHFYFVLSH